MKKTALLFFMFVLFLNVAAIEIDVETALKMAYSNNAEIKNAEKNLENYNLLRKEAVKTGLPKVGFTGQYGKAEDDDSEYGINSVKLEQTVFAGGAVLEAIKVSGITKEYGEIELEKMKKDVKLEVLTIYSNILKFEKNLITMQKALEELNENYKLAEEQYSLSMITKTTLLQLKYRIIDLESQIIEMQNAIETTKMTLKKEIGVPAIETIELKKEEYEVIMADAINFEEDLQYAETNNDNIKMVRIATKLQKSSEVIDRAELLPKVGFEFSYGNSQSSKLGLSDSFKSDNMSWNAGIGVSMTLWDWGKNYDKLKRAKNETEKTKNTEKDTVKDILIGIRSSYMDLIRLQKLIEAKKEAVESAEENYKLEKEKFEARLITATDFLEAENQVRDSRVDLVNTKADYYVAYQNYLNLIGR